MVVKIELSKNTKPIGKGKTSYTGKYTTIIDDVDADLAQKAWKVTFSWNREYACRFEQGSKRVKVSLHRIIMERVLGRSLEKHESVDHRDGNGLNNTRENLRLATPLQQNANRKRSRDNTSGYKGVGWSKSMKKWRARITCNGKQLLLGYFDDPYEAYLAYCAKGKELFGEFFNGG